MRRRSF